MPSWLVRIRDIVWTAVLSVVCVLLSVVVAIFIPGLPALAVALGLAGISLALLATRV